MAEDKSIDRFSPVGGHVAQSAAGRFVKYTDHLDALGEAEAEACTNFESGMAAEKSLAAEEQHRLEVQRACIAANRKLETLRSGLKAEVETLRTKARSLHGMTGVEAKDERWGIVRKVKEMAKVATDAADRLTQLLDASEDTGEEQ